MKKAKGNGVEELRRNSQSCGPNVPWQMATRHVQAYKWFLIRSGYHSKSLSLLPAASCRVFDAFNIASLAVRSCQLAPFAQEISNRQAHRYHLHSRIAAVFPEARTFMQDTCISFSQCLLRDGGVLKCSKEDFCGRRAQGHVYRAALHKDYSTTSCSPYSTDL